MYISEKVSKKKSEYNLLLSSGILLVLITSGCCTKDYYINGNSNLVNADWQPYLKLGKTTESEIIAILGQPNGYYHRTPNQDIKWLFYTSTETTMKRYHLPFLSKAQFACKQESQSERIWFLVSQGIVTKQLITGKDPDLREFILSDSSGYPYSTSCTIDD